MDTLRILVDEVEEYFKPRLKMDERIEREFIAQKIRDVRNKTIRELYSSRIPLNMFAQTVNLNIIDEDNHITIYDATGKEKILERNKGNIYILPIPRVLSTIDRRAIHYIGSTDFNNQYHVIYSPNMGAMDYSPWSAGKPCVYTNFTETKLYYPLRGNTAISCVCIFEDPMDVPGMDWDSPYPIGPDVKEHTMYYLRGIIAYHLGMPVDYISDNIPQGQVPQLKEKDNRNEGDEQP